MGLVEYVDDPERLVQPGMFVGGCILGALGRYGLRTYQDAQHGAGENRTLDAKTNIAAAGASTAAIDGIGDYLIEPLYGTGGAFGLENYPSYGAGIATGFAAGDAAPTPQEAYRAIIQRVTGTRADS